MLVDPELLTESIKEFKIHAPSYDDTTGINKVRNDDHLQINNMQKH